MLPDKFHALLDFIGWPGNTYRLSEQWVASLGAMIGVFVVWHISHFILHDAPFWIIPSLGASAVLIFAIPHSPLTQPWAVLGGHTVSALIGVSCRLLIPDTGIAVALAVGLAIVAMHRLRCLHPPGGATALTAVIGGPAIHALGYSFVLAPIALSCLLIIMSGIAFNHFFPWRRYPASLMRYAAPLRKQDRWPTISQAHIDAAMSAQNVVLDINSAELAIIIEQTLLNAAGNDNRALDALRVGAIYGNEKRGKEWAVRQIIEERHSDDPQYDLVIFKILEGDGCGRIDSCSRQTFSTWLASELHPKKSN